MGRQASMKTAIQLFLVIVSYMGVAIGVVAIPIQIAYRLFDKKFNLWYYFHQIAISNDSTVGSLVYGSKHTVSGITGEKAHNGSKYHKTQEKVIDSMFGKKHCFNTAKHEGLIDELS